MSIYLYVCVAIIKAKIDELHTLNEVLLSLTGTLDELSSTCGTTLMKATAKDFATAQTKMEATSQKVNKVVPTFC